MKTKLSVPQQKAVLWFGRKLPLKAKPPARSTVVKLFKLGLLTSAVEWTGKLTPAGEDAVSKCRHVS